MKVKNVLARLHKSTEVIYMEKQNSIEANWVTLDLSLSRDVTFL